jgi:hypothetical protein
MSSTLQNGDHLLQMLRHETSNEEKTIMAQCRCTGLCVMNHFKINYDISKGLPPTIKNRLEKKKCNSCAIWMRIDSWWCFCCGQRLSKRRKRQAPSSVKAWKQTYPTFEALNMIPEMAYHLDNESNKPMNLCKCGHDYWRHWSIGGCWGMPIPGSECKCRRFRLQK